MLSAAQDITEPSVHLRLGIAGWNSILICRLWGAGCGVTLWTVCDRRSHLVNPWFACCGALAFLINDGIIMRVRLTSLTGCHVDLAVVEDGGGKATNTVAFEVNADKFRVLHRCDGTVSLVVPCAHTCTCGPRSELATARQMMEGLS